MAFKHGKGTRVYLNGYDLSAFFRSASLSATKEVAETTTFGDNDKEYVAGLRDATMSLEGLFDGAVSAVDEVLKAALDAEPSRVTYFPEGDANGNRAYGMQGNVTSHETDSPLDDVVAATAEIQSNVGPESILVHHALGAETIDFTSTNFDGVAATTNGGVGYLHVTAYSGFTNVVVTIEDSADGATGWATILTFATITASRVTDRVAIAGTVKRHTRVLINVTGTGSIAIFVGFGRK